MIERLGGVQWPLPEGGSLEVSERRLFTEGCFYSPDGRARSHMEAPRGLSEPPSEQYPFQLLTGRGTASQWPTQTRTSKSEVLKKLYPQEPFVEINPADARELGLRPNQKVLVPSQRGRMAARAVRTHAVQRGQVFIPMHYEGTKRLTDAVFDPLSKQPSYKSCAVKVMVLRLGA